jgi:hypothetical protein
MSRPRHTVKKSGATSAKGLMRSLTRGFFYRLAFHDNEKPRGWVRILLFSRDSTPRKRFRRIVFKKNGNIRPQFATWMILSQGRTATARAINAPDDRTMPPPGTSVHSDATLLALHNLKPLEETTREWKLKAQPSIVISDGDLTTRFTSCKGKLLVISIGHDNYRMVPGGIQLCIQREERLITGQGDHYLNLRPFQPLPRLAHLDETPDPLLELTLNGVAIGAMPISGVISAVSKWTGSGERASVVVHHLLGHNPENISMLVRATNGGKCIFWLHDFFSLCTSYTLQRNGLHFCKAPAPSSNACNLCVYGEERLDHLDRMTKFFDMCNVQVVSPSVVTLQFWLQHSRFRIQSRHVEPHVTLSFEQRDHPAQYTSQRLIRVAFLGTMALHKGWPLFEQLASNPSLAKKFRFYALTSARSAPGQSQHVRVQASADNPNAMIEAVGSNEIDFVLHWPTWPETFSLTTCEAIAGGAYVITNSASGNVAATVNQYERGVVLRDEQALLSFFEGPQAESLSEEARRFRSRVKVETRPSKLSLPFLDLTS